MKKLIPLQHHHTAREVAALLQKDPGVIDRLIRCHRHPVWKWAPRWKEPRFAAEAFPEWRRILDTVDLDSLPEDPPPLERPEETFSGSRRGPTDKELAIAGRMCGISKKENPDQLAPL
jgi:hypothetical protein